MDKRIQVGKLFAKHKKVKDQESALQTDVRVAVGTPNRVLKLYESGALSLIQLQFLVLDLGRDVKKFTLFTMPTVSQDFFSMYKKHVHSLVLRGQTKICIF